MKKTILSVMFLSALLYGQSDDPFARQREAKMNRFLNYYHLKMPPKEAYQIRPCMILAELHDMTVNGFSFEIKKYHHDSIAAGMVRYRGRRIASIDIETRENPRDAAAFLSEWITSSSMPLTQLLQAYIKLDNGCGELCFATSKNYDTKSGIMSHANGRLFFSSNGLIVRVINLSENCNIYAVANLLHKQIMKVIKTIRKNGCVLKKD